jgi:putative membrane protein
MSTPNYDPAKLASIKTYITVAFIFNILIMVAWALSGIYYIYIYATFSPYILYGYAYGAASIGWIITGIVFLVFLIFSVLVFMRTYKMYNAVNKGDIATLKQYNNMMWAILALIFAGVIPGIMLLISVGPINELGQPPMGAPQGAYAPPPPPPAY